MKYVVKNPEGQELTVPTLADLAALYHQGFVSDDDLIRSERSDRWVKAGAMPALRGMREERKDPRKMGMLLVAAMALALGLVLLAKLKLG